jgi:hypothetical protein
MKGGCVYIFVWIVFTACRGIPGVCASILDIGMNEFLQLAFLCVFKYIGSLIFR